MTSMKLVIPVSLFLLFIGGLVFSANITGYFASEPGKYDDFAKCLTEKGAKIYGAYWCPHCQDQKSDFGSSWKYVDYVECDLGNGQGQKQVCTEAGVSGYPTWIFADGSSLSGEQSFSTLAKKTLCNLSE